MQIVKKLAVAAGLAVVAATVGGVVAYASVPSADGTITACVAKSGGAVRIVDTDAGQTCTTAETKVSWGSGMHYVGTWAQRSSWNGGSTGYPIVHKGDVMYYDGAPNAFGCTSPRGAWVSVAGSYAYPCLEFPQNWAPVALDGKDGKDGRNADVHWAQISGSGALTGSSDAGVTVSYAGTGQTWVRFSNFDPSKCAVSATVSDYHPFALASAYRYPSGGWVLVSAMDVSSKAYVAVPIDLTLSCGKY